MSQPQGISGSPVPPVVKLTWSDELGKRVREGDWKDQAVSTTRKIGEAIAANQWELAAQLVDYWMEEAKVVHVIYQVWTEGFLSHLREQGVPEDEIQAEFTRLREVLAFPDGTPFQASEPWRELGVAAGMLGNCLRGYEITAEHALAQLDALRESWRQLHDRGADFQSGLLTFIAHRFGEESVVDAYARVLEPYLDERYKPFDVRERPYEETLYRNLYLSFEAMRGHLVGPERNGDMEVDEYEDRFVISFDPCGSGGRSNRGDPIEETPPRPEPPYSFAVTTEEHDWAWNEKGVCIYCAHCCFALEYWPAKQWGHPLRVIDSPLYPDETSGPEPKKCTWTIYKTIDAIPSEAYERIGMTKPG
jgi:hypothetical protein